MGILRASLALLAALACGSCRSTDNWRQSWYTGEDYEVPRDLLGVKAEGDRLRVVSPGHGIQLDLPKAVWRFDVNRSVPKESTGTDFDNVYQILWAGSA